MLTGENGLINQAEDAKLETRAGTVQDKVDLWKSENKLKQYTNGTLVREEEMLKDLTDNKYAYEEEIDREAKTITIGKRVISYKLNEVIGQGKKSLKMIVNSGEDGIVGLPISYEEFVGGRYEIDWGDGSTGYDGTFNYADDTAGIGKVASIGDGIYIAIHVPQAMPHTYETKNKEYEVTISGEVAYMYSEFEYITTEKIIEITQWGEIGLEMVCLVNCTNLRKIASPSANSFVNIDEYGFEGAFAGCTSLKEIPGNLFANCPNITTFEGTFYNCTNLKEIPGNLFANCPNIITFERTFYNCTSLTGEPIKLWEKVEDGEENNYEGIPEGYGCYYNCTGLTDYDKIPEYWKIQRK